MRRIGLICLFTLACFLSYFSTAFPWQEPTPSNYVSDPPPTVNPQLNASGGSTVDVLTGHTVSGAVDGIDLLTAGYTVTNNGSIFSNYGLSWSNGVSFQQGGILKNYGAISGLGGVSSTNGTFSLDNQGDITGRLAVHSTSSGDIDIANSGRITGTTDRGVWAISDNGNIVVNNRGDITGGMVGVQAAASGNISVTNSGRIIAINDTGVYTVSNSGNIAINNHGEIAGSWAGVYSSAAGNISITNSGTITSTNYFGAPAVSAIASNGNLVLNNYGDIIGVQCAVQYGVYSNPSSNSDMIITNTGRITATGGYGVRAELGSGNIAITNQGDITADTFPLFSNGWSPLGNVNMTIANSGRITAISGFGVHATTSSGNVAITNQGDITGGRDGIWSGTGYGDITITNSGRITGSSEMGIGATSWNGNVFLTNYGVIIGGQYGVHSDPSKEINISNAGQITGTTDSGIYTAFGSGNVNLNNQGDITGGQYGVYSAASGNIRTTNSGRIIGTTNSGVYAVTENGNVAVNNQGGITGGQYGIYSTAGGSISITNSGTITGTTDSGVYAVSNSGNIAVNNQGGITGGQYGIYSTAGGSIGITNSGTITGPAAIYHIGAATLENWGTIQGDVVFPGAYPHSVALHTGTSINGNILGGSLTDDLTLDGAGTLNFQVTDFDTLTKTGAGLWDLTHDLNLGIAPGTASISGGTLAVNASLTASQVSVLPGATLQGTGTVVGNVSNSGTVAPGNSIGTLYVRGNYVQGSAGALAIEVDSTGAHDVLVVTGAASLAGRLEVYPLGFIPTGSMVGSILTASGGITGQFDQTMMVIGSSVLSIMPVYRGDSVDFLFSRNYSGMAWGQQRLALAHVIDGITSLGSVSADMQTILARLDMASFADFNFALGQMNPAIYDGLKEASFIQGRFFADASLTRLDTLRGTSATTGGQSSTGKTREAGTPGVNLDPLKRVSFFMQGGGEFYDRSSAMERVGYSFSGGSFLGGADCVLSPWLTAGLTAGYASSSLDFNDSGSKADLDSVYTGGYAGFSYGDYFADMSLGYVFNSYDMRRRMLSTAFNTTAYSSFDGGEFLTKFQFGRRFEVSGFGLTPVVKVEYANLNRDSFVENGAGGLNLAVNGHSDNSLQSSLGGSVDYRFDFGDWSVTPMVRAFWVHEMLDDNLDYISTLTGIPNSPFVTTAMGAETDAVKLGAGVKFGFGKHLTAYVAYDAVLVSGYDWHNISGGFKVTF